MSRQSLPTCCISSTLVVSTAICLLVDCARGSEENSSALGTSQSHGRACLVVVTFCVQPRSCAAWSPNSGTQPNFNDNSNCNSDARTTMKQVLSITMSSRISYHTRPYFHAARHARECVSLAPCSLTVSRDTSTTTGDFSRSYKNSDRCGLEPTASSLGSLTQRSLSQQYQRPQRSPRT